MDKDLDNLIETVWLLRYQKRLHAKHGMATEHDELLLSLALDRLCAEWRWRREHTAVGIEPGPLAGEACQ